MNAQIEQVLRSAKADQRAGKAVNARRDVLNLAKQFPNNIRLSRALSELQQTCTGLPVKPFNRKSAEHFIQTRNLMGLRAAIEEISASALLNPQSALAQGFLGAALLEANSYSEAAHHLNLALNIDPQYHEAKINLSYALAAMGETLKALSVIDQVLIQRPNEAAALLHKARLLSKCKRETEAAAAYHEYSALQPNDSMARAEHAIVLTQAGHHQAAEAILRKAVSIMPTAQTHCNLGNALLSRGAMSEAVEQFQVALKLEPASAVAFYNLGRAKKFLPNDPEIESMEEIARSGGIPAKDIVALHFGLAKAYEDVGNYDLAFAHIHQGNEARSAQVKYDIERDRKLLSILSEKFSASCCPNIIGVEAAQRTPIFILGMMRSGTTLLEQMLSSHPSIYGAGELEALPYALAAEYQGADTLVTQDMLTRIRSSYLGHLDKLETDKPFVIDKLPANFRLIGLIRKALPEAHIFHMQRDPIAICWSIFKTMFTSEGIGYAHRLTDIIAYYDLYEEVMRRWRAEYPSGFVDVRYEDLIAEPERSVRSILDDLGLKFDPACLDPRRSNSVVRTASARQVREGIYGGSNENWKRFEGHLEELVNHFRPK